MSDMEYIDQYGKKLYENGFNSLDDLLSAYEQVKAERDSAVEKLRDDCTECKHFLHKYPYCIMECCACYGTTLIKDTRKENLWEWRALSGGGEEG